MARFTLNTLEKTIAERAAVSDGSSYTATLISCGIEKCAQKLGEEAVEAAIAAAVRDRSKRKPLHIDGPVRIEVDFHHRDMANRAAEAGDCARDDDDRRLIYAANDVPTAVRALWRGFEMALREDAAFLK